MSKPAVDKKRQSLGMGPKGLRDALDEKAPAERQRALTAHASQELSFRHAVEVRNEAVSEAEKYLPGVKQAEAEKLLAAVEASVIAQQPDPPAGGTTDPVADPTHTPATSATTRRASPTVPRAATAHGPHSRPAAEPALVTSTGSARPRSSRAFIWLAVAALLAVGAVVAFAMREVEPVASNRSVSTSATATAESTAPTAHSAIASAAASEAARMTATATASESEPSAKASARVSAPAKSAKPTASSKPTGPSPWDGWDINSKDPFKPGRSR